MPHPSAEGTPCIPPVTPELLDRLDRETLTTPTRWVGEFQIHQMRLYSYCFSRLRDSLEVGVRTDAQAEISLMYAGLRATVREAEPDAMLITDLPQIEGLASHIHNAGRKSEALTTPYDEVYAAAVSARFAAHQPYLLRHFKQYADFRRLSLPTSEIVTSTAAFIYDAVERQIQIDLLDEKLT